MSCEFCKENLASPIAFNPVIVKELLTELFAPNTSSSFITPNLCHGCYDELNYSVIFQRFYQQKIKIRNEARALLALNQQFQPLAQSFAQSLGQPIPSTSQSAMQADRQNAMQADRQNAIQADRQNAVQADRQNAIQADRQREVIISPNRQQNRSSSSSFKCSYCQKQFQLKGQYDQHYKRHQRDIRNQHHCQRCGLTFLVKPQYKKHCCRPNNQSGQF